MTVSGVPSAHVVQSAARGATDLLASPLAVEAADAPAIEIVLDATAGAWRTIRGRLLDRDGSTEPRPQVTAVSPLLRSPATGDVDRQGTFEIQGLPPGAYDVQATPGEAYEPIRIMVDEADVAGVTIVRPRQVQVNGRIVLDREAPMPRPSVGFVRPRSTMGALIGSDGRFSSLDVRAGDSVTPGTLPPGYTIESLTGGDLHGVAGHSPPAAGAAATTAPRVVDGRGRLHVNSGGGPALAFFSATPPATRYALARPCLGPSSVFPVGPSQGLARSAASRHC